MKGGPTRPRSERVTVGVADVLPKLVVYRLLAGVVQPPDTAQLVVVEDKTERLLAELALHNLDIVLTDSNVVPGIKIKAYYHPLGACGVSLMAAPELAKKLAKNFPHSLDGAPLLLPAESTSLRRSLEQWFAAKRVRPLVAAEFADSALLKTFGQAGVGAFAVPSAVENDVREQYGCQPVGRFEGLMERFFAVTVDRRLRHPAVLRIQQTAQEELFPATVEA
jgi:LysR family transcriptional regulator, transcriptional activator of nhaA